MKNYRNKHSIWCNIDWQRLLETIYHTDVPQSIPFACYSQNPQCIGLGCFTNEDAKFYVVWSTSVEKVCG